MQQLVRSSAADPFLLFLQANRLNGFVKQQKKRAQNAAAKATWLLARQQLTAER